MRYRRAPRRFENGSGRKLMLGLFGIVEIAAADAGPANTELARHADRLRLQMRVQHVKLRIRDRAADRNGAERSGRCRHAMDRDVIRAFRGAIGIDQRHVREMPEPFPAEIGREAVRRCEISRRSRPSARNARRHRLSVRGFRAAATARSGIPSRPRARSRASSSAGSCTTRRRRCGRAHRPSGRARNCQTEMSKLWGAVWATTSDAENESSEIMRMQDD